MNVKMKERYGAFASPSQWATAFWCLCFSLVLLCHGSAKNATTDPSEVKALNSIFQQWDIKAPPLSWNISGEPCSGSAIGDELVILLENAPRITCNCSYNSSSICHITHLNVNRMRKQGVIIPQEIVALRYLKHLELFGNYFTGPLPGLIGDFSSLEYLDLHHNYFTGQIPASIGELSLLEYLDLSVNNFTGVLPRELGNLVKLRMLCIDSSGVGGKIPSTFSSLRNMKSFYASNIALNGRIPDFLENWTKLATLRLQGNSFEGPIPFASFSKLTQLEELVITDIYTGTSTFAVIKDLKNLSYVNLRNALITGTIPSSFAELQDLVYLDLSFNNLTGQIPNSLFNMTSLQSLFLGNNSLSGPLPRSKNDNLMTIDLSYNYLSGRFPDWISANFQSNRSGVLPHLNLVANKFMFDTSNASILDGLQCLQRNFLCNKISPLYESFSINCGGPEVRGADDKIYEADNLLSDSASYFISADRKWAMSTVEMSYYSKNTSIQVGNTETSLLIQTSRTSRGSLRYYGLGLKNGPYIISLLFPVIGSESIGGCIFDIYIQGGLREKDFDISKEAGRFHNMVNKTFKANVSENFIEVHLFWAGKGTHNTPYDDNYGSLISALTVVSDFPLEITSTNRIPLTIGIATSIGVLVLLLAFAFRYMRGNSKAASEKEPLGIGPKRNMFTYNELRSATRDFNNSNKLGEGGFGSVYKGILPDGRAAAVKQLSLGSFHGNSQFIAEIATILGVRHRNLVELYGYCIEGNKRLLVYEYLENRSLDQALFGKTTLHIDWPARQKICLGIARGIAYLHEESRPRIVHRDIKASNILLDAEFNPKISDFGLAKLYDDDKTHISTRVAGTIGYWAPEYALCGHLTEKADVFSFGVVALEIVSGWACMKPSLEDEEVCLLDRAWSLYVKNQSLELVDPSLAAYNENEVMRMIAVALLCTQGSPQMRPLMSRVVAMLLGDIEVGSAITRPNYLTVLKSMEDISPNYLEKSHAILGDNDIIG